MIYFASAPATLMLMGEHAVLHQKLALVCAVNQRISVKLKPRSDRNISIQSALGSHQVAIENLSIEKPFQFVLASLLSVQSYLKTGCDIYIESEFSHQVGLGSSAAVTAATITALHQWLNLSLEPTHLILQSREVVRKVQGIGSGADIAASILGGTIAYKAEPLEFEKLQFNPKICAVYSGSKMPTPEVIAIVESHYAKQPDIFKGYFEQIEQQVTEAKAAITSQNWNKLAQCFKANQNLMQKLGVSNSHLQNLIEALEQQPGILAAKISGSGLGDCLIGLGALNGLIFPRNQTEAQLGIKQISIEISEQGVVYGSQ
ncbi:MAG: galK [Gammaproteobacteria bacterium]|jgi:mevalonate kinase|nr:galK [Gammaproteobacteria bacterium]